MNSFTQPQSLFRDRHEAGRRLAGHLVRFQGEAPIVLGLARGGVPVASEVARVLRAPWDVFLVRKLGMPGHEEFAMGAIASGNVRVLNEEVVNVLGDSRRVIEEVTRKEMAELNRREASYHQNRPHIPIAGRLVIVVDDGLATGASMKAAVLAIRQLEARSCIVAAPVGAPDTCEELAEIADEVVCPFLPADFQAVGVFYDDFSQTSDEEVRRLLADSQEFSP